MLTKKAIEKLRRVKEHILAEPRRYNQNQWIATDPESGAVLHHRPPCGTVACVAGWVCQLEHPRKKKWDFEKMYELARKILGITQLQADSLFKSAGSVFPPEARSNYFIAINHKDFATSARIGAEHIERFIERESRKK